MNDGGMSADKPSAGEAEEATSTSYTYPDWEWVNGVAIESVGVLVRSLDEADGRWDLVVDEDDLLDP